MSTQVASKPVQQVAFTNKQGTVVMLDKHKRRRYIDNDDKDMYGMYYTNKASHRCGGEG